MTKNFVLASALVIGAFAAVPAAAQSLPFSVEVRGGVAHPTGDWADDNEPNTGVGFGATAKFWATPMFGVYGGWERFTFDIESDGEIVGEGGELTDSGIRGGIEINIPVQAAPVSPFLFGGVFYGKSEIEEAGATTDIESKSSVGFEGGAGINLGMGPVSLRPAVSYRTHQAEFPNAEFDTTTVSSILFTLGVSFQP